MRFLRRSLIGLFLLSATIGLLAYSGQLMYSAVQVRMADKGGAGVARERVFAANVMLVEATEVTPVLTTFGEVRSRRTLELRAPGSGTVISLADGFEDGASVKAGQLLLRLDPADAKAARDLALTDQQKIEAEVRDALRALALAGDELAAAGAQAALRAQALARQNDLKARGVGSEAAVETAALAASSADQAVLSRRQAQAQAQSRVDQSNTALARQQIALAEAERALAETELFAQFDGSLSDVSVVAGGIVGNNERLALLIDPDALEVAFRISTSQYVRLLDNEGRLIAAPVQVALDVLGAEVTAAGRVSRVSAAVGAGQTGRLVYADIAGARGFRPGDFVTARIDEPMLSDVIVLPATAVDALPSVLVLGPDDRLEQVLVEVLRRQGNEMIVRAAGLAGREVVLERSPLLGVGIKVRPIRPQGAEAKAPAEPEMVELTPERRAQLIAFVEGNERMPKDAKARVLAQLAEDRVPAQVVARIEERMGG